MQVLIPGRASRLGRPGTEYAMTAPVVQKLLAVHAAARQRVTDGHMYTVTRDGHRMGTFRLQLFTAAAARPVAIATQTVSEGANELQAKLGIGGPAPSQLGGHPEPLCPVAARRCERQAEDERPVRCAVEGAADGNREVAFPRDLRLIGPGPPAAVSRKARGPLEQPFARQDCHDRSRCRRGGEVTSVAAAVVQAPADVPHRERLGGGPDGGHDRGFRWAQAWHRRCHDVRRPFRLG